MSQLPLTWETSSEHKPRVAFLVPVKLPPTQRPASPPVANAGPATPQKKTPISVSSPTWSTPSSKVFASPPSSSSTLLNASPASSVGEAPDVKPTNTNKSISTHNSSFLKSLTSEPASIKPSFTSMTLPVSLLDSFSVSEPFSTSGLPFGFRSLFDLLQFFHLAGLVLSSVYPPEPSPVDIVSTMIQWKDTPTVAGFLVRAAESNIVISMTERLQIVYLLAFSSKHFALKIATVLSVVEDDRDEVVTWLGLFMKGVEYKLKTGSCEMEALSYDDQKAIKLATNYRPSSTDRADSGDDLDQLRIISHPSFYDQDEDHAVASHDEDIEAVEMQVKGSQADIFGNDFAFWDL